MQTSNLKLYTYFRSTTSWRVRIALSLKKLQYESIFINLKEGQQRNEEFAKVNPNLAVPTLVVSDVFLVESVAICEYLDEVYPQVRLLPSDPILKAQVRGFCEIINSAIHPYQNLRLSGWVEEVAPGFDRVAFMQPIIHKGLTALDQIIEKTHGKYSFGDQLTMADVFLVPQVSAAVQRYQADMNKYPTLKLVYQNLKDIPEFVAALPENQADAE